MIEFKTRRLPFQSENRAESWLRSLPSFDPGDTLERIGSDVADLVPGRRRSRGFAGWALPALAVAVAVGLLVTMGWLMTHRPSTLSGTGLDDMVPDPADFDRDAGIRAASEGMAAPDRTGTPADEADTGAL